MKQVGRGGTHAKGTLGPPADVEVVIPSYNMSWCLQRAVESCLVQSLVPVKIIIIDDASTDNTEDLVQSLYSGEKRIRYVRSEKNEGHLASIIKGVRLTKARWIALLDADDELLEHSLETRIRAANEYARQGNEWPELIYGDLYRNKTKPAFVESFKPIAGFDTHYLLKELSLCQTSTILLGNRALETFATIDNPYNTDDEIVIAVAKSFPIVHCGEIVTLAYDHASDTRMTNSALRRLKGIILLVRHHQGDIRRTHGFKVIFYWYLRIFRVALEWQIQLTRSRLEENSNQPGQSSLTALYLTLLKYLHGKMTRYLLNVFEHVYF